MKKLALGIFVSLMATPVLANGSTVDVPEMDAGAAVAAIALLAGAAAIIRERRNRK